MTWFRRLATLGLTAMTIGSASADDADHEAVRQLLSQQVASWNRGDLKAFMETYWKSPDLTFYSGGEIQQGWESTYERFQRRYQAEGKRMGKLQFSDLAIDALSAERMLVRGRWRLEQNSSRHEGLFTLIVARTSAGWRIIHDHTSRRESTAAQP